MDLTVFADLFAAVGDPPQFEDVYRKLCRHEWPPAARPAVRELLRGASAAHSALTARAVLASATEALHAVGVQVLQVDGRGRLSSPPPCTELTMIIRAGRDGRVGTSVPAQTRALRKTIAEVSSGSISESWVRIGASDGHGEAYVHCRAAGRGLVSLAIASPERRTQLAATEYQLSPRETELLARLISGLSLPDAARQLGIAPSTARTHLNSVFSKTGANSQSQLINLVVGLQ